MKKSKLDIPIEEQGKLKDAEVNYVYVQTSLTLRTILMPHYNNISIGKLCLFVWLLIPNGLSWCELSVKSSRVLRTGDFVYRKRKRRSWRRRRKKESCTRSCSTGTTLHECIVSAVNCQLCCFWNDVFDVAVYVKNVCMFACRREKMKADRYCKWDAALNETLLSTLCCSKQ